MTHKTREQLIDGWDEKAERRRIAEQKADEAMALWIGTKFMCDDHGRVDEDDEEPRCKVCGELATAVPVFRGEPEEDLHPTRAPR